MSTATSAWAVSFGMDDCKCANRASLFEHKYLRTHRAGSVKLVRCFPHCCPKHTFANFCTTSLDVVVSNATLDIHADMAYLRFQPSTDRVLAVGDVVDEASIAHSTRSQANIKGDWIASDSRQLDAATMTYRFNHNNLLGWHYGWMGTSTKAHRTATHRVVAYVFRRLSPQSLHVVGVALSPSFIIMSYRRACYHCQRHRGGVVTTGCECDGEFNTRQVSSSPPPSSGSSVGSPPTLPRPSMALATRPVDPMAMERQLGTVMSFLHRLPSHAFAGKYDRIADQLTRSLLQPLGARWGSHRVKFPRWMRPPPANVGPSSSIEALTTVCLDLFLASVSMDTMFEQSKFMQANAPRLLDRQALQDAYLEWLQLHYRYFNHLLEPMFLTLDGLATHINAVSQTGALTTNNALPTTSITGFENFVAQLREVYMGVPVATPPVRNLVPSLLNGHWVFQETLSSAFSMDPSAFDPSVITIVRSITMTYAFQWVLSVTSLHMRSDLEAHPTQWSEMVLDGHPHVFRVFPNGEASMTMVAGYLHGDYRAWLHDDQLLTIQIYTWGSTDAICVRFQARAALGQLEIQVTVVRSPIVKADGDDWSTWTASARCAAFRHEIESVVVRFQLVYKDIPLHETF
ncbi:hypothetical protein SDRG_04740 [Saprolegnia diclina VS20]|uniref:Uncharacterized protein n=1 Tax=Saprolegnia diclina (strain VS20) TaxID=1156394 RepID=T0RYN9_SAPDV|nr:hypothetical protein SDRG_04740 [Saprolegnia diclina VS20]EQC37713.1 hypothetical protein SDRG_04740 [Saprolegnia diclina VS20]|eukprot:XP_008608646.1 hypothetical protein SDRG_04740 [Saprolegnia diclina VS20]